MGRIGSALGRFQARSISSYSQLTEEQAMLREMCRNFANTELVSVFHSNFDYGAFYYEISECLTAAM